MWIDDELIRDCRQQTGMRIWIPHEPIVVVGNGNERQRECYVERCHAANVEIVKRCGGGGAVVLHPGCVVIGYFAWVTHCYDNQRYFDLLTGSIISCLSQGWPELAGLSRRGISDIAWGQRKVAGTSLFRSRNFLLFQASLLVDDAADLLAQFLRHPSSEPDYRQGKEHADFVTGLDQVIKGLDVSKVAEHLSRHLATHFSSALEADLIASQSNQWRHLDARVAAAAVDINQSSVCARRLLEVRAD